MKPDDTGLLVRYWAGAKAAAGTAQEYVQAGGEQTVADVVAELEAARPALAPILEVSSLLLDGKAARRDEQVGAAQVLEVLPPFAGG
ncbi:MAG: MoaD/ThiS family protein [Actinomycetia bacterium]|nr:MoaD/ThiS family protein [Actinomycetes bacterium]